MILRQFPYIQTSVFVDDRFSFSGNQLATFWNLAEDDLTTEEMQGITREINFSETTFVLPPAAEKCIRKVRIFTPEHEIPFAGHPTLGTAFVLKKQSIVEPEVSKTYLELGIGPTAVEFREKNYIQMYQSKPEFLREFTDKTVIAEILGISSNSIVDNWPMQYVSTGHPFLIIPLTSLNAIQSINLNTTLLLDTLKNTLSQDLLLVTPETIYSDSHAHARMFAPSAGVFEDPATGSAAGPLGAYLEKNLILYNHTKGTEIILEQGYEMQRPSRLVTRCLYEGNDISEMIVGGQVKLTAQGDYFL